MKASVEVALSGNNNSFDVKYSERLNPYPSGMKRIKIDQFNIEFQEAHELAQNILEALAVAGFKPAPLKNNDHEDDEND
jgi:hypothetical protein